MTDLVPEPMTRTVPAVLALEDISKSFGGTPALSNVSLQLERGEVRGLVGENGAGKSTLIKILAGYHTPDAGSMWMDGRRLKLPLQPGEATHLGLEFVHQDLGLIPSLSVVENLRVEAFVTPRRRWNISLRREGKTASDILARYGVALEPTAIVGDLRPVERALLAVVRAVEGIHSMSQQSDVQRGVLVLDEPTVFLPRDQTDKLFALMRQIAESGATVLFVGHDLEQVREITDRITVLRDGHVVGTVVTAQASEDELVAMIVGRVLDSSPPRPLRSSAGVAAAVSNLSGKTVTDVSFVVREGEVLGLTGLVGSGFDEVPYLLFGASRARDGILSIGGNDENIATMVPSRARHRGMALIPADRLRDGIIGSLPVLDNVMMNVLGRYFRGRLLRRRLKEVAGSVLRQFDVRPPYPWVLQGALSGGNQQKALLAKWLQSRPSFLLLHEPTQGVDVGARQEIYRVVRDIAIKGSVVVCASADYGQVATICDRVLLFREGRIDGELAGAELTKERLVDRIYRSVSA